VGFPPAARLHPSAAAGDDAGDDAAQESRPPARSLREK